MTNSLALKGVIATSPAVLFTIGGTEYTQAAATPPPSTQQSPLHTITSSGHTRSYLLSTPEHFDSSHPIPVIFAFHGHGQDAQRMETYSDLDQLPAVIVYPDGNKDTTGKRAWESAPYAQTNTHHEDSQLVRDILHQLDHTYSVDHSRIYATGKSNGGGFAARLGCTMPDVFAAVAPVAGAYYPDTHTHCATTTTSPVSIMEVHGTDDKTIDYQGGTSHGKHYISGRQLTDEFARRNRCATPPPAHLADVATTDGAKRLSWTNCAGSSEAVHYAVQGGGHNWPGSSHQKSSGPGPYNTRFSTTTRIWEFFSRHHH